MRPRFWMAFGALALAVAVLSPTLAPLSGSMDAFASELANGSFRPLGQLGAAGRGFSSTLGGFTGQSSGNFLPGGSELPPSWKMDRDGTPGNVVIDYVFNPALGAMKRLKAYDRVAADGATLEVSDQRLRAVAPDPALTYDRVFEGSFDVQLRAGEPIPIFSPHPKAIVNSYSTQPAVPGGLAFFKDGADTFHVVASVTQRVHLNLTYVASRDYYSFVAPERARVSDYPASVRPTVPASVREDAEVVLARAGVREGATLAETLDALNAYFRSFTEGDIPPPREVEDLYLALALGGHGCCRHRAFAYMLTAQAAGVPTRVVVNEAHAFVEVMLPDGGWHQVNLGGCGTYEINNPRRLPDMFEQADDPRAEANPLERRPLPTLPTLTNITESPPRIVKGERYFVNGTVVTPDGRPVEGARIDVFLNETKETPGRLTGAGTTDAQGLFSVVARVPRELTARSYQLVARSADAVNPAFRYEESWSDPPVDVFTPTRFVFPDLVGAAGFPFNVSGRLVDVDGNPVPDAPIEWTADGRPQPPMRTGASGLFNGRVTFNSTGPKDLAFRYPGDDHHGPSEGQAVAKVQPGALLLPLEAPVLARGETTRVRGSVAVAGVDLDGQSVRVTIASPPADTLASASGLADRDGDFSIQVSVPAHAPIGIFPARYTAPALGLDQQGLVRIAIRPTLVVDAPAAVSPREPWVVEARLLSDNGTALAGRIVEMTLDANRSTTRALLTNSTGYARFEMPARALGEGDHAVLLSFPGDADHATAAFTHRMQVARPWWAALPWWGFALAAALVAALVVAARLSREGGPLARLAQRVRPAARPARWRVVVDFPDHPEGVQPVYEPGEAARARVRVRDREGRAVAARALLAWPDGRARGRTEGEEGLVVDVRVGERDPLALEARVRGLARLWTAPARVELPVRPYRRAVEDGFVALRARARLDPSASSADLVRALAPRLRPPARARLREATALFDVADYSEGRVDRGFYHAFAAAKREVESDLEA